MCRRVKKLCYRCFFHDAAGIHDRYAFTGFGNHTKIVADQHQRHAHLAAYGLQQFQYLRLDGHIQGGRGFVSHQQFRLSGKGDGNHHALILAA